MGQTESSNVLLNYGSITRDELNQMVSKLNTRCEHCFVQSSVKMLFAVKYQDENSLFWKKSVRIRCFTTRKDTPYCKNYGLYEFLKFFRSLSQILCAAEASTSAIDLASNNSLMEMSIFQESCNIEGHCIICFENKPNSVLPCAHAYCDKCIDKFRACNQNCCPLCRHQITVGNDSWVVTEKPEKESINVYLVGEQAAGYPLAERTVIHARKQRQ
uniref:RING-type domain-containing protein n=1 Tax=Ditylenchus dipsaci TaxID=166011 RepID=A0A915D9X0_9BILA